MTAPLQPTPQAAPVAASDWTEPTTYLRRFGDAMQLLCAGHRPTHAMMSAWLDSENEELQSFAAEHGPAWAQGIGLIDAARTTADQPTEGPDHEFHEAAPVAAEPSDAEVVLSALTSGEWGLVRNLSNACFTDEANSRHAWSVRRLAPPYCADRHDSERQWSGPTARQALQTASDDLDVPLPAALAVSPAPQAAPVAAEREAMVAAFHALTGMRWQSDASREETLWIKAWQARAAISPKDAPVAAKQVAFEQKHLYLFNVRLSEYGVAMSFRQSEKCRVLAEVLESMFKTALSAQAAPVAADMKLLTDAEIQRIAERIGQEIPGRRNYDSWGSHYYRRDEEGNFNIPMVPPNALPFARAIEAAVIRAMKGTT